MWPGAPSRSGTRVYGGGYRRRVRARPEPSASGTGPAAAITFEGVAKTYPDGTQAVADLDLQVRPGELLVLVGPSGCGKSTTMRMVNRLVDPTAGRVLLDGADVAAADPVQLRRGIGYVIQNVGLFPHRTVGQNVATVPALLGWDRARSQARVSQMLELVGLPPDVYAGRYPHELSGGEQQRVGVARALAAQPRILLMDEPFGAVDPVGRARLQQELRGLHRQLAATVMFVTHDIDEAMLLGDRVAVFSRGGHLEQVADPVTLLTRPATEFVRTFVGRGSALRLLSLVTLTREGLEPTAAGVTGEPLPLGTSLAEAFAALAANPQGRVAVTDETGAVVGSVTPAVIHRALSGAFADSGDVGV